MRKSDILSDNMEARKRGWRATALFVGSTLGAGVFGLPYVFAQTGWGIGFLYLIILSGVVFTLQLMYAEVAIQTPGRSRISGLAGQYLGPVGCLCAFVAFLIVAFGVLLAYLLLGATFLSTLLGQGGFLPVLLFFLVAAGFVVLPLRRAASLELVIGAALLLFFLFLILVGLPEAHVGNLTAMSLKGLLIPYGVVLFSLSNSGAVPEMHALLGERYEYRLPKAILAAYGILVLLYVLFTAGVVAVSGSATTPDAITGYGNLLSPIVLVIGSFVGLLTVLSAFGMMGQQLKDLLHEDAHLCPAVAIGITLGVPLLLYASGVRSLIGVLGFTGSVGSALLACIVLLTYESMKGKVCRKTTCLRVPRPLSVLLAIIFVSGAVYELLSLL